MSGIPPVHEEQPVGTNNVNAPPASDPAPDVQAGPAAPAPPIKHLPPLPADWSPVDPAPADAPRQAFLRG